MVSSDSRKIDNFTEIIIQQPKKIYLSSTLQGKRKKKNENQYS